MDMYEVYKNQCTYSTQQIDDTINKYIYINISVKLIYSSFCLFFLIITIYIVE